MDGEHIIAFAEESDPGKGTLKRNMKTLQTETHVANDESMKCLTGQQRGCDDMMIRTFLFDCWSNK